MRHGDAVRDFETAFAARVNAKYAIAMTNGTVTLEVALRALNSKRKERLISTTPLTMAATSIAIWNTNLKPRFLDIDPRTWLMIPSRTPAAISVSLYGLHYPCFAGQWIDDAAQTLRPHHPDVLFTSYSLQRSKIVQTGEGGVLVTNDEALACMARSIASLGYELGATQSRIDVATLKSPTAVRHVRRGLNARMNDVTATLGLAQLAKASTQLAIRRDCAHLYATAIEGIPGVTPQHVPDGWTHDYWTYAIACTTTAMASALANAVVAHGGERPYASWRLTFAEPAFIGRTVGSSLCYAASDLQPRLLQFQTNDPAMAFINAKALRTALTRPTY